jgi:glutamyl-Q tRNA(Asp) synthetase
VNASGEKLSKQTHAEAIDPREPSRVLVPALHFLGQVPPEELSGENTRVLWDWATTNWRLERVPKERFLASE